MKKCVICHKMMTDNLEYARSHPGTHVYSKDAESDARCDSCDAKSRARSCARTILGEMGGAKRACSKGGIMNVEAFLGKEFERKKNGHIARYTGFMPEEDRQKYSFWIDVFNREVEKRTESATRPEEEEKKKYVTNY